MKFALGVGLLLLASMAVIAVENGQVMYVSGTVPGVNEGVLGKLDFVSETSLIFAETGGSKLAIPFAKMESYEYSNELAHHLGVLPAIGVGLVKKRQRKHFFRISFRDEKNVPQVAIFAVPKHMPQSLLAVLQLRAPQGCKQPNLRCVKVG